MRPASSHFARRSASAVATSKRSTHDGAPNERLRFPLDPEERSSDASASGIWEAERTPGCGETVGAATN